MRSKYSKGEEFREKVPCAYDEATGTLLSQTTPDNLRTINSYDNLGRLEKMTLPDGSTQHRSYDSENNVVRQWGSQQYPVSYEYDAYGRKTSMATYRSPIGPASDVAIWPDSSAEGDKTTWSYDPATGNLLKKTYDDGRELSYTYTPGGKIKTQTNARGHVTTCTYNSAGQQVNLQVNDNGITPTKTVAYDQLGRKTQVTTEGISTYQYVYNDQNQLIEERITIPPVTGDENINLERSIVRFYDAYGRPMGYQLKHGNTLEQAITYSYNAAGQVGNVNADGKQFSYSYVPQAPQLMGTMDSPVHSVTNVYYEDRDVLQIKLNIWKNKPDNAMISRYIYDVNSLGQRTSVRTAGTAFDVAHPADWQWSYDALGQVKSANQDIAENYQYVYDQIGNRITTRKGTAPELTYTSNSLNQYTAIGSSLTPSYDADGNQLGGLMPTVALPERGQLAFVYNAENRPLSVSKNGILQEAYSHDHMGRRIQEGNTITIYDGYNAIAEYTVNGILKTTYAWGLDMGGTLKQQAGGVGGLLSQTDYTGQTPLVSYPTYDGNGNVTEYVTEANNGTITAHYEYDAFGNVINANNPNNTPTGKQYRYQFSTKPYNRLTGLNYYNYRDYDPAAGRWIGRDALGEKGGLNLYGFVGNLTVSLVDALGQQAFPPGTGGVVGAWGSKAKLGVIMKNAFNSCSKQKKQEECPKLGCCIISYCSRQDPGNPANIFYENGQGSYSDISCDKAQENVSKYGGWNSCINPYVMTVLNYDM